MAARHVVDPVRPFAVPLAGGDGHVEAPPTGCPAPSLCDGGPRPQNGKSDVRDAQFWIVNNGDENNMNAFLGIFMGQEMN